MKLNNERGLADIRNRYLALVPTAVFDYEFSDEQFAQLFRQERTIGKMTNVFCLLSILLAGLGLYSIANLALDQRAKEIGIRKILGAGVDAITVLLGKEFLILVLVSFVIAIPLAWYFATIWLDQFAYQIDLGWLIFSTSILIIFLVTLLSISVSLVRGNRVNPVKLLRSE